MNRIARTIQRFSVRRSLTRVARGTLHVWLILAVTFFGMGGADLFFGWKTPLAPNEARAAYTGKQLKTVEYILGGGSDPVARGDNVMVYAGSAWNTTKSGAGTKEIVIEGSNIRVVHAFVELSFYIASAVTVANIGLVADVEGATSQGTDARIAEELSTSPFNTSGTVGYLRGTHEITALFQHQTDAQWNAGVGVVVGAQIDLSAAGNRELTTTKLVITYESDYALVPQTETKTVRFPLRSTAAGDIGTRASQCAAASDCTFTYLAEMPDLAASADLLSVFMEMQGETDSASASSFAVGSASGTATTTMGWAARPAASDTTVNFTVEATSTWNFATGSLQRLVVRNGAVPANVLGGELVVTYRYSTGAARQTETVRYFLHQRTTAPGTSKNYFSTTSIDIFQSAMDMEALWLRVHISPTAANTFTVFHKVGTSSESSRGYAITAVNSRAGETPTIIQDMSNERDNFFSASTIVGGATQFSAGGAPPAIEAFFTFTWDGTLGSRVTKTVLYSAAQQGVVDAANYWNNRTAFIELPETATKRYRSAYLLTEYSKSDTTSITNGTFTNGVNGVTTVVTESTDGTNESYNSTYLHLISSSTLSGGETISWPYRSMVVNQTRNTANEAYHGNQIVVTYDVDFSETPAAGPEKQLKTVEYILGGGSDNTARADDALVYAGSSWNATKSTAGFENVVIAGSGIRVVHAYVELSFIIASAVNVNNIEVIADVEGASSAGSDVPINQELSTSPWQSSGLGGSVRATHEITALFDRQTDSQWNAGLDVVVGVQVDLSAAGNRALTTAKLVITYESNYSLVPHDEVKTVRFPLDSTATGDTGTRQTQCAAAATCPFSYFADIPDATADADILDVFFEISGMKDSATASTFQPTIAGGSAGPAFAWTQAAASAMVVRASWEPPVGGADFLRNTAQTLNITLGSVPLNVLGGELVVTYRYSTGAARQTETVRYFLEQETAVPGTTKTAISTTTIIVANGGFRPSNIWLRAHIAPTAANNFTVFGRVGTSTEKSNVYAMTGTNSRLGDHPRIVYDMSADTGNMFASTTDIAAYFQFSAGQDAPAFEAFVTFTWNGDLGGPVTKTVSYSAAQQGVVDGGTQWNNRTFAVRLPESVTKRYRSAYLEVAYNHSDTTSIANGVATFGINASTTDFTESNDGTDESYTRMLFFRVASSTFSGGENIDWMTRSFLINEMHNQLNEAYWGNQFFVTYDAEFETKVPKFIQNYFQFFVDNDALLPTDVWPAGAAAMSENADLTLASDPPLKGENVRLRMSVQVATTTMLASTTQFKLQYGERETEGTCAAVSLWSDVGAPGSGAIWRGVSGAPADGQSLSTNPPIGGDLLLSVSDRAGSYEEANPTAENPFNVAVDEDVEFDWNIESNGAATSTPYCFRMTKADGEVFDEYTYLPTIWTAGYVPETRNWRWYDDENNATPVSPLAAENVAPSDINNGSVIKLRITVDEMNAENGVAQKFYLQYSTVSDFSSGVVDVAATTTCTAFSGWCYADAAGVDNQVLASRVLTDSSANGTHNEAPTTTSAFGPLASTPTEFEFTITHSGASPNTTYFFRLYDYTSGRAVPVASGESYPSLSTGGTELGFTVSGLATSTVTEGITTDVATEPDGIRFGRLQFGVSVEAAQRLSISTNATRGYQVFLVAKQDMLDTLGNAFPNHQGTNAAPLSWAAGCPPEFSGCVGYHAGDDTLAGGSTRFLVNDTYAAFATTGDEVAYHSTLTAGDVVDMVMRIEARPSQPAGEYTTQLVYIVVPIF